MKSMLSEPLPFSFVRMKTILFAAWTALCFGSTVLPAAEEIKPIATIDLAESLEITWNSFGYERAVQFCVTPDGEYVLGAGYGIKPFYVDLQRKTTTVVPAERPDDENIIYLDDRYFLLDGANGYRWLDFNGNRPDDFPAYVGIYALKPGSKEDGDEDESEEE